MKIRHVLWLILLSIFFLFSNSVLARRQAPSLYQAFINSLASEQPDAYSNYLSNGACYIIDLSEETDFFWYGNSSFHNYMCTLPANSPGSKANRDRNSDSYSYVKYLCIWSKKGSSPIIRSENKTYTYNSTGVSITHSMDKKLSFWNRSNASSSERDYYFTSYMTNTGRIGHMKSSTYGTVYTQDIYIGGTTEVCWADLDIHWDDGNVYKANTKSTSIPNVQFDFNGNWSSYELYEYLLYYISNNYNLFAETWASGANPSCMIFNNLRGNIKANRLNSNFLVDTSNDTNGVDYLAVFYPDRFCCFYDSNNHDYYFNFFSLRQPFFYITITKATQAIQFYYMDLAYNNNTPVVQIHYEYPESLIFTNKNIVAKSDANNFIFEGTSFTWWRTTSYERQPNPSITVVNPDNQGSYGNGSISVDTTSIENKQDSIIDKITGFFSGFFDTVKNAITSVFDFLGDTILALWNTIKNQILSKLPVFWITDIISWIQDIYHNAVERSQNLDFIYHFNFLGKNIEFDPLIIYKNNKIYLDKFLNLGLIVSLVFYNIRQIFVVLKGGKQG